MRSRHPHTQPARLTRWYRGADIPKRLIRRFAREVAARFHPEKIILFGSRCTLDFSSKMSVPIASSGDRLNDRPV